MTGFDVMVSQLVAMGFSPERAEAEVREQHPHLAPAPAIAAKNAAIREKQEQAEIVKLFRAFGVLVYSLSQARASKQTPGLPDLWCMHPDRGVGFWFECKRQVGGKLSPVQRDFAAQCDRCKIYYFHGDRRVAARVLIDFGLARVGNGPCGIVPYHEAADSHQESRHA